MKAAAASPFWPALDGLRGLAVLLVLAEHFTYSDWVRGFHPGMIGVRSFFVLSGFLITGILLAARDGGSSTASIARNFFRNRVLRLAPPLLAAVALAAALDIAAMRQDALWHLAWLSNVLAYQQGYWPGAGHFWTLALEEQFYLLWFPAMVLLPRRAILPVTLALVLTSPAFRLWIVAGGDPFLDVLLPSQVDALALGALLAQMRGRGGKRWGVQRWAGRLPSPGLMALGLLGLVLAIAALDLAGAQVPALVAWLVVPALVALFAAGAILSAIGPSPPRLLLWQPMRRLGRISYGIYIYHYFMPPFVATYLPGLAAPESPAEKLLRLAVWIGLTLAVASLSWQFLERPALALKARAGGPGPVPAAPPSGTAPGQAAKRTTGLAP